ncbi:sulfotransferase [Stenotrophomonas phage vB_SmaS-DLP_6]|nr:sulfotransferase [Stenotrophomonas phage vB_SmaS-DLP_6]
MIIASNYVFVAVSRAGSVSLRDALRKQPFQYEQDPTVPAWLPFEELQKVRNSHITISQLREWFDPGSRFSFAFVRNPWDRFISFCAWGKVGIATRDGTVTFANDPRRYMSMALDMHERLSEQTTMMWEQSRFIDGGVDFTGRYEHLQRDFDHVCDVIKHPRTILPLRNRSKHDDYRTYYTPDLVDRVAELYKRDIAAFGYTFEE